MSKTVENLSAIRQTLDSLTKTVKGCQPDANAEGAGREMALVITKLEEARMWAGKALSNFETGFKNSDIAGQPETFTKEVVEVRAEPVAKETTGMAAEQA